jgi:hypothetical protein
VFIAASHFAGRYNVADSGFFLSPLSAFFFAGGQTALALLLPSDLRQKRQMFLLAVQEML